MNVDSSNSHCKIVPKIIYINLVYRNYFTLLFMNALINLNLGNENEFKVNGDVSVLQIISFIPYSK